MFIFIAGVQPKTKKLSDTPQLCPSCGRPALFLKRTDHFLSLFFIPLIRIKKGHPFYLCHNCRALFDQTRQKITPDENGRSSRCPQCGAPVSPQFSYCPYCGKPL
ncbi:MAG: zinc ribbon domain-containing protein [Acidobacteriota bacterium]